MADQTLELIIKARDQSNAAFDSLIKNLKETEKQQDRTKKSTEAMSDKLGKFAGGVDIAAKKLAGLGEAAGLPADKLRVLSDVADVAGLGMENLSKSSAGFNAASAGVAAAGFAIGTAIGSWLNTFPAVREAVDGVRDSLMSLVGMQSGASQMAAAMQGMSKFNKEMAASNADAVARQIAGMKAHGNTVQGIAEVYKNTAKEARTATDRFLESAAAETKAAAAAKEHAAQAKAVADAWEAQVKPFRELTEAAQRSDMDTKLMAAFEALGPLAAASVNDIDAVATALSKMGKEGQEASRDLIKTWEAVSGVDFLGKGKNFGDVLKDVPGMAAPAEKAVEDIVLDMTTATKEATAWQDGLLDVADAFARIGGKTGGLIANTLAGVVGISDSMKQWKAAGSDLGGILSKAAAGLGIAGTVFGIGKSLIGGLFGKGEEKDVNKRRQAFIDAAGGLDVLNQKAHAAGMTLDALLDAKKVDTYTEAQKRLTDSFDLQAGATDRVKTLMQEVGLTAADMGTKFQQMELDQQAASMTEKWEVLHAAGASFDTLINKMGPDVEAMVQQAVAANLTLPESMRPMVDMLIDQGKILDENGQAYESTEEAGITFAQSVTEATLKAAEATERLVEMLERMFGLSGHEVTIPVNFPVSGGGEGGGRREPEGMADGDRTITGWGIPAVLHGTSSNPEFVNRGDQIQEHVRRGIEAAGGGGGGGQPLVVHTHFHVSGREMAIETQRFMDLGKARSKNPLRGRG